MDSVEKSQITGVKVGPYSYGHNRFLLLLASLAAIAFVLADSFGIKADVSTTWFGRIATPQMIWALLLVPIAIFGALMLKRSGHRDTSRSCLIVGTCFLIGATAVTFASS